MPRRDRATASRRRGPDVAPFGSAAVSELARFTGCESPSQTSDILSHSVQAEVEKMRSLLEDADAFDVVELMRLREIPIVPVAAHDEGFDGWDAIVDLVALLLIARGSRNPNGVSRADTRPHVIVPELHEAAAKMLRISTFKLLAESALRPNEPLARVAAEYQAHHISVRSMQYETFHDAFNDALFNNERMQELMRKTLGFTYAEFEAVRIAIQNYYSQKLTAARDLLAEVAIEWDGGRVHQSQERVEQGRKALTDFMFLPADRAQFRASEIAARSGLAIDLVESILAQFALPFDDSQSDAELIFGFLRGDNPLSRRPLIVDNEANYLMAGLQIGTDSLRRIVEDSLKLSAKDWNRYDKKIRKEVSEKLAADYIQKALRTPAKYVGLHYFAPKSGVEPSALNSACLDLTAVGDEAEADCLFLIEDAAICVEVKARSIAEQARRGDLARLSHELEATIGSAAQQARRLEKLIEANQGIWLADRSWLDLSQIREVRSIAVGLDDYGPLGIALDELRRAGIIGDPKLPWVTSLHDLAVICSVVDRPSELLLYIRRRADSGVAHFYSASDELDLFMLFLDGGLYVEPDPDAVHAYHPTNPPPRPHHRRQYAESARPTRVGTFTDPLDAWFYSREGSNPWPAEKPTFTADASILELVDFLADGRKPGWFRFGADLLSLSGKAQSALSGSIRKIARQTRSDKMPHRLVQAFAGEWGHPSFFAQTRPTAVPRSEAAESLIEYMQAKKHQLQSDRALAILLNAHAEIEAVYYANQLPSESVILDKVGKDLGLLPVGQYIQGRPPSARRTTRQLRGRKSKKRRT